MCEEFLACNVWGLLVRSGEGPEPPEPGVPSVGRPTWPSHETPQRGFLSSLGTSHAKDTKARSLKPAKSPNGDAEHMYANENHHHHLTPAS